jgi:hypothetical protein
LFDEPGAEPSDRAALPPTAAPLPPLVPESEAVPCVEYGSVARSAPRFESPPEPLFEFKLLLEALFESESLFESFLELLSDSRFNSLFVASSEDPFVVPVVVPVVVPAVVPAVVPSVESDVVSSSGFIEGEGEVEVLPRSAELEVSESESGSESVCRDRFESDVTPKSLPE